ncbi:c-type cytochrome [Rhizobium sp. SAFR-030]|uniref:c-type cytochrome n=1 Tax=Rhizobium sp. SAFR-030 TaxID=3387277 RepID=UPI003F7F6A76
MRAICYIGAVGMVISMAGSAFGQDAAAGEKVFAKCKACHVADTDQNKIGPSLKGVIGRPAASREGFKYSAAMADAGKAGMVWDEASLTTYLRDPKGVIKGTKMAFVGLKTDKEIADVIAYLKQFSP